MPTPESRTEYRVEARSRNPRWPTDTHWYPWSGSNDYTDTAADAAQARDDADRADVDNRFEFRVTARPITRWAPVDPEDLA